MNNDNILISCVIPVYNRQSLVLEAVNSVLGQSHKNIELVVVDDGSTDGTGEILKTVDDNRMKILRQDNKGVSSARNAGIAASSGPYIALLDSDDYWQEKKLQVQLAFMLREKFVISQTEEIWIRRGKRVNPMKKHAKPEGFFFGQATKMCLVSPSCVMFTREYWQETGPFDESMPACEDYDLWLRTLVKYPVGLLREKLTVKRGGREDQLSNSVPCQDQYRIMALEKILKHADITEDQIGAAKEALAEKIKIFHQGLVKRGRLQKAARMEETAKRLGVAID